MDKEGGGGGLLRRKCGKFSAFFWNPSLGSKNAFFYSFKFTSYQMMVCHDSRSWNIYLRIVQMCVKSRVDY